MQALILAGGKGTRLRPLTVHTPKPIVPVMNRPFLLYQIDILKLAGITDIILSLNYQPDKIRDLLGDGSHYGVKLTYLIEPQPLGTGGAFGFARERITEATVVLNGDILTNLPISEMAEFHRRKQAEATIYLTPVEDPTAYGLVETEDDGRVRRFLEKPRPDEVEKLTTRNINAGIYILEPGVLDLIPEGENCSFEYNVFPGLLKNEKGFYAFIDPGAYWRDIGNPKSYLQAHADFLTGKISGFSPARRDNSDYQKDGALIDENSIIGANCVIKSGVRIINSVLGQGVHLDEKAVVENSVVWPHTHIGNSASVTGSFIGRGCHIGNNTAVGEGSVLGDKSSLTNYTQI
jgi:NDP-sugar pyrophosphorylase family protein